MKPDPERFDGLSGAGVSLVRRDGRLLVRKVAATPAGSDRLRKQARKQEAYRRLGLPLATPEIVGEGTLEDRYYFDMEYVGGTDGHRFIGGCTCTQLKRFVEQIAGFLRDTAGAPGLLPSAHGNLFEAAVHRLLDIQARCPAVPDALLGALFRELDKLRPFTGLATGFCHGDLTLENVLVDRGGRVWLVDLLDSPFEHPWQDYVKLSQDLDGGWYLRRGLRLSPAAIWYARRHLDGVVDALAPDYRKVAAVLSAVNFARILPYTRTPDEWGFVLARIERFTELSRSRK